MNVWLSPGLYMEILLNARLDLETSYQPSVACCCLLDTFLAPSSAVFSNRGSSDPLLLTATLWVPGQPLQSKPPLKNLNILSLKYHAMLLAMVSAHCTSMCSLRLPCRQTIHCLEIQLFSAFSRPTTPTVIPFLHALTLLDQTRQVLLKHPYKLNQRCNTRGLQARTRQET